MSWTEIDGSSTAGVGTLIPWSSVTNVKSAPYNITGSGADEAPGMQLALNQGGTIIIPSGLTVTCSSANLSLISNTNLVIERGATLWLKGVRLSGIGAGITNISITGGGAIKSTTLNTTDAAPTNWARRGIVEFGGTTASIGNGFYMTNVEVYGDFSGTPTGAGVTASSKRVGVCTTNAKNIKIVGCDVHNTYDEDLMHNGSSANGDANIEYIDNWLHDSNHDAIGPMTQNVASLRATGNTIWNCLNGVELPCGVAENNLVYNMQGSGFTLGGNAILAAQTAIYNQNVGVNNCLAGTGGLFDFSMNGPGPASGTLILNDNQSIGSNGGGFQTNLISTVICKANTATGWGILVAGTGIVVGGTTIHFDSNSALNEGANSTGGFNVTGTTALIGVSNRTAGVAVPWVNTNSSAQGWQPSFTPVMFTAQQNITGDANMHDIFTYTVPANSLGKTGGFRVTAYGVTTGANAGKTMNVLFGGTNIGTVTTVAGTVQFKIVSIIVNAGATGSQLTAYETLNAAVPASVVGTASIATTSNQNIVVQGQLVNGADNIRFDIIIVESLLGLLP